MRHLVGCLFARVLSAVLAFSIGVTPTLAYLRPAYADSAPVSASSPSAAPTTGGVGGTVAQESSPTVVRELTDRRTENSTSYLLSNGEVRTEITEVATRFMKDGGWTDINTYLVPGEEPGAMQTIATPATINFDAERPAAAPVTIAGAGYEVGLDMLGVAEGPRITLGDTTRYLDVMPAVDLEYQATRTGVKGDGRPQRRVCRIHLPLQDGA